MKTFLVIACLIHVLEGYTLQMETQLHAKITSGYNRRLRPGDNRKVPTDVEIDFYMRSLKELLEGDGKISIAGGFKCLGQIPVSRGNQLTMMAIFLILLCLCPISGHQILF